MKKIIASLVMFSALSLNAMQRPEQSGADMITLVAKGGAEFKVPADFAQDAGTIEALSSPLFIEGPSKTFTFNEIEPINLGFVAQVALAVHQLKDQNLHDKALLDAIEKQVKIPAAVKLLETFNFLDYPIGKDLVARVIAQDENKSSYVAKFPDLAPLVARYYYLLNRKNLAGVDHTSYGFSIRDYLDYQSDKIIPNEDVYYLRLSNLRLNNLQGLMDVPGVSNIPFLNLDNNQLKNIEPGVFNGLAGLRVLKLDSNQLKAIKPGVFNGLVRLYWLHLEDNQLKTIKPGVFNGLVGLQGLYLNNNQLSEDSKREIRRLLPNADISF